MPNGVLTFFMENKRDYIKSIILKNAKNEMEKEAILDYAIKEEVGLPTPKNDLPNLKKDRIDFELVNRTNEDQTINLFELPQGINPAQDLTYGELFETWYSQTTVGAADLGINQTWTIDWIDEDGASQSATTGVVSGGITDLINSLIVATGDNWSYTTVVGGDYLLFKIPIDTWVYWNPPPATIPVSVPAGGQSASFYTQNKFDQIEADTSTNISTFTSYQVIGGTGISVTDMIGNLTYAEITQELRNNFTPYIFNTMTIYADSIDQANSNITKVLRQAQGNSTTLLESPAIVQESQFVVTEKVSFLTTTLSSLKYTVKAGETVRVIITYSKGNLNAIVKTLDVYIQEGLPFNIALEELPRKVSEKEAEYLKQALSDIWRRRKIELAKEGVEIDLKEIFGDENTSEQRKALGEKMKLVNEHIENQNKILIDLKNKSKSNVKNIVSDYIASGKADEIYDPYSYMNDISN